MKKSAAIKLKLKIMPDDGRWAWWDEDVQLNSITVKPNKGGWFSLSYHNGIERRTVDVVAFRLEGSCPAE